MLPARHSSDGLQISELYENLVLAPSYFKTRFVTIFLYPTTLGGISSGLQFHTSLSRTFRWPVCLCSVHTQVLIYRRQFPMQSVLQDVEYTA